MELKTIISELKDLESGLCFLTEEHMEAIKAAWQIVERVDEKKIGEIIFKYLEEYYVGPGGRYNKEKSNETTKAITDYLEGGE